MTAPAEVIAARFELNWAGEVPPRYNIAPAQPVAVIRETAAGRTLSWVKWGLAPSWAKDASIGTRLINARGETLGDKPAFRNAYGRRHCLVPADAFYEWKPTAGRKQPYCIRMRDQSVFGIAGLWEQWRDAAGELVETCTLITVDANAAVRDVHERMPLILAPHDYQAWLKPETKPGALPPGVPAQDMAAFPVSPLVSNARNDVPACLAAIDLP